MALRRVVFKAQASHGCLGCIRFGRQFVKVSNPTGVFKWALPEGSSVRNLRSKLSDWSRIVAYRSLKPKGSDVGETVLRRWVRELTAAPVDAFPGLGKMKPEQEEIARLQKEVAKLKMEHDILKKAAAYFARESM